jgi:hypothetical protein
VVCEDRYLKKESKTFTLTQSFLGLVPRKTVNMKYFILLFIGTEVGFILIAVTI